MPSTAYEPIYGAQNYQSLYQTMQNPIYMYNNPYYTVPYPMQYNQTYGTTAGIPYVNPLYQMQQNPQTSAAMTTSNTLDQYAKPPYTYQTQ